MEILRIIYQKELPNSKKYYPIWIDSELFWNELGRYCKLVILEPDANDFDERIQGLLDRKIEKFFVKSSSQEKSQIIADKLGCESVGK